MTELVPSAIGALLAWMVVRSDKPGCRRMSSSGRWEEGDEREEREGGESVRTRFK
jgi:hypothetical protein